ncbi:helix-turn-helix transcriptional regulator [Clostridium botulinum D/C]|uniref:helix-turn-helix transcriptional regulator n=1 Tax=Clostridium botulinum TaxID=1491 RepID=UPI001E592104|nr:helix-turn-helix transcriptional regulator [Clostridium botulinum D/C]MCD3360203.1 helix-turn-helix transcriptional regulator [Clostridium botulinum D/C]MCD3361694.1 helix-turn-helix transcriptional regulator [Clostridium botulinum D/C]MCD3366008.1 helix-turn-helix transcriptional regulator [Clostridium botulinum D/C]
MNRKEFDDLNVNEQLNYINENLTMGKSLTELANEIKISRSTLRKRFKKIKYIFNQNANKYICDGNNTNATSKGDNNKSNEVAIDNISKCDSDNIDITFKKLNDNADKILEMLEWWGNRDIKKKVDISKLNNFENKTKHRSFNINSEILNKFTDFCNTHREYMQVDLISIALLEFLEKYN